MCLLLFTRFIDTGLMEEDLEAVFAHAKILFAVSIGKVGALSGLSVLFGLSLPLRQVR